ncbi:hypothetical protein [Paenibacillus sp. FSL R7-0337]|uniref:hypothetical protein n=1 Tax=Paenibacillus sp. FSL R7-0337 TaxID=1926588 RepID=UPI0035578893
MVINEGLRAVKEVKAAFPNLTVLADLKIMELPKISRRVITGRFNPWDHCLSKRSCYCMMR